MNSTLTGYLGNPPQTISALQSALQAQNLGFSTYAQQSAANWIGVQDSLNSASLNFNQVGIVDDNADLDGCNVNDEDKPVIFAEVAFNGVYQSAYCADGYILGPGSQTYFNLAWYPSSNQNYWIDSVYWDGYWEEIISATFGSGAGLTADRTIYPTQIWELQGNTPFPYFNITNTNVEYEGVYGQGYYYWQPTNQPTQVYQNPNYACVDSQNYYWNNVNFQPC